MPLLTPPCDSIPWYITAFQSSPVRIWGNSPAGHACLTTCTHGHTQVHTQGQDTAVSLEPRGTRERTHTGC